MAKKLYYVKRNKLNQFSIAKLALHLLFCATISFPTADKDISKHKD